MKWSPLDYLQEENSSELLIGISNHSGGNIASEFILRMVTNPRKYF